MKKTVLIIFILTTVLGVSLLFDSNKKVVTIQMTDAGFSPMEVTIPEGATVTWKNIDSRPHWPASAFHPTHTQYPERGEIACLGSTFDACRGIKANESWSFTFDNEGAWSFHDHLNPGFQGVVHVSGTPHLDALLRSLTRAKERVLAWTTEKSPVGLLPEAFSFATLSPAEQTRYITQASEYSPSKTWAYLKKAATDDSGVTVNAHDLAHIIGNNIYKHSGIDGIVLCDATFAFGCYHGVTEELFRQEGPASVAATAAACRRIFKDGDGAVADSQFIGYTGCIHGMGHGLLTWENLDLDQALNDCDSLWENEKPFCYDGVFMEYTSDITKAGLPTNNSPWELCTDRPEQYRVQCARYLPNLLRTVEQATSNDIATVCEAAPTDELERFCVNNIGYYISQNAGGDTEKIRDECRASFRLRNGEMCIKAAAVEIVFQNYASWQEQTSLLCSGLSEPVAAECEREVGETATRYNRL